ncbi:sensor histidine kinase [Nonomuraea sp. NPDC005983]|uniref:sensor histidine kinase n=1 Tax=Nonomuraea sp. NPDC005983 TaxID=3155595 RepID=UPI0033AA947E
MNTPFPPALRLLRWVIHGTFAILLAIAIAGAMREDRAGAAWGGLLLGLLYGIGLTIEARLPHFGGRLHLALGRVWLLTVTAGWAVLALSSPRFVWLAFPLFFACLHLLPLAVALPAVTLLTAGAVAADAWHTGSLSAAQVVGPMIGAIVATLMALVYKVLHAESEQRRELIDHLVRTQDMLLRAESESARLAERERLAREIHDTLAQGMSSIILLLRAVRANLSDHPERATRHIAEAEQTARENLEEARHFVRGLAPPALQQSSLGAALRRIGDTATAGSDTGVRFEISGTPVPLPAEHELALLRIAQGALGNVTRHSQARHAGVTLTYLDDVVVLDIYDDGRGFRPDQAVGYGLRAMRERVTALGGSLAVESAPGEGTAVAATLPLPVKEAP